jgi:hypothetical protein
MCKKETVKSEDISKNKSHANESKNTSQNGELIFIMVIAYLAFIMLWIKLSISFSQFFIFLSIVTLCLYFLSIEKHYFKPKINNKINFWFIFIGSIITLFTSFQSFRSGNFIKQNNSVTPGMNQVNASQLNEKAVFYDLAALQDKGNGGGDDIIAQKAIAIKYGITRDKVLEIMVRGAKEDWPIPR